MDLTTGGLIEDDLVGPCREQLYDGIVTAMPVEAALLAKAFRDLTSKEGRVAYASCFGTFSHYWHALFMVEDKIVLTKPGTMFKLLGSAKRES